MINRTAKVVLNLNAGELDSAIRESLEHAADVLMQAYECEDVDLRSVSTKTNATIAFAKFVKLGVLKSKVQLGEHYIANAFAISQSPKVGQAEFETFMVVHDDPDLYYSKAYSLHIRRGLGMFLISLHSSRAITLPMNFKWPGIKKAASSVAASQKACAKSEILSFIRGVETVRGRAQDPAFSSLRDNQKRIEWFSTYATRVVLACGWHTPEEISLEELSEVYLGQSVGDAKELKGVSVFGTLIEILAVKFGSRLSRDFHDPAIWKRRIDVIRTQKIVEGRVTRQYGTPIKDISSGEPEPSLGVPVIGVRYGESSVSAEQHFKRLVHCMPAIAHPDRAKEGVQRAVGDFDFVGKLSYWIEIQEAYLTMKRETLKPVRTALGYLNLYLFHYLPYWYMEHSTSVSFPSTPDELIGSVFISRILEPDEHMPRTLMDFMNERAKIVQWDANSYYSTLKQIETFFEFIIRNNHKLKHSSKFTQPLASDDYPRSYQSVGTNKSPMPRRFLALFVSYIEAYRTYVQYVADRCIAGEVTDEQVLELTKFPRYVDTKANAENIGFVPLIFVNGKTIPLWWLPGFPKVDWMKLRDGRTALVPHPHGLNQIAVALYTGLRHNHIQWLDAKKFDSYVGTLDGDYTRLFVNTDKIKKKPWLPEVNVQVIQILRDQLRWRNSIDEHGYDVPQWYNSNPATAYPKFLPLFAYGITGAPHGDAVYTDAWQDSIVGFQCLLRDVSSLIEDAVPELYRLRPVGMNFHENDAQKKYNAFQNVESDRVVLKVATEITPHSARVSVVSELIRFLPAAIIGRHITGQTEGTVYHYVVADADEIKRDQVHQAMHLRDLARRQQVERICGAGSESSSNPYIKADQVNSNLAKSLKVDMPEAIARYGCISLTIGDMETGIDVLEDIGLGKAAYNKTEICPFGNHCPPALIKQLRGIRRCGICPYAVRSIDHLPAVCARQKVDAEKIVSLDARIRQALSDRAHSPTEVDALEDERQRVGEELAGWELSIEVLEQMRQRITAGEDNRRWVVERPEILAKNLQRVATTSRDSDYLLARLAECTSYPGFQSPQISRQFDMLRRRILAKSGASLDDVLSLSQPVDSAAECAGLIRSLAAAHQLTVNDIAALLSTEAHLSKIVGPSVMRIANAQT
jgi:hypothetical protein